MAVRFDVAADNLTRTASLPATTAFSCLGWVYFVVLEPYAPVFSRWTTAWAWCGIGGDSSSWDLGDNVTDNFGTTIAQNTWYHVAWVRESSTVDKLYVDGAVNVTVNLIDGTTPDRLAIGGATWSGPFNGRMAAVKIYDAALTLAEISQERRYYQPVRTANLNTWSPLLASTDLGNYAGTGAWTLGGTLTTENGPPIAWGPVTGHTNYAAAGGGSAILSLMMQYCGA